MATDPPPPRTRSVRLTLVSLLMIPLLSLAALWGFIASVTLGNLIRYQNYNTVAITFCTRADRRSPASQTRVTARSAGSASSSAVTLGMIVVATVL